MHMHFVSPWHTPLEHLHALPVECLGPVIRVEKGEAAGEPCLRVVLTLRLGCDDGLVGKHEEQQADDDRSYRKEPDRQPRQRHHAAVLRRPWPPS